MIQLASMSFRLIEAERAQDPVSLLCAVLGVTRARAAVARAISGGSNWPSVAPLGRTTARRAAASSRRSRTGRASASAPARPLARHRPHGSFLHAARRLCDHHRGTRGGVTWREAVSSTAMALDLIEFPADDLARARRFWETLLGVSLDERREGEGQGLQTHEDRPSLGLHERGRGPGDRFALPYFLVSDLAQALERVVELGGSVVDRKSVV